MLHLHKHGRCGRVGSAIALVRYIKILTRLRGFGEKIANFYDSIASQSLEETGAQRKPNPI